MNGTLILGAGGHGKVVADILLLRGIRVLGFLDDQPGHWGSTRLDLPVLGSIDSYAEYGAEGLALGIGDTSARRRLVQRLGPACHALWVEAIHPRAVVAASARLGIGATVAAGAVINPDAELGDHVIVNTGATVDHDCVIGAYVHIAPGAHLAGGVRAEDGVLVGIGANVLPGCVIGRWSVIGGGSTVIQDVPAHVTAIGAPARWPIRV